MEQEKRPVGKVVVIVIVVVIAAAAAAFFLASRGSDTSTPSTTNASNTEERSQSQTSTLTFDEIEKHNSEDDCWTVINGNVYDLTSFIARHPGGDEILRACGEDATSFFESRTDEDGEPVGSGTPHSASAESQLQTLLLGPLQN